MVKTAAQFVGDYKPPRTSDGHPDLQGFWTNATVSRMDRPSGYPLIINDEQAASLEGRALFNVRLKTQKAYVDPKAGAPEKGKALPGVGNYDVAYTDPGNAVINIKGELRSAYITFPENGRTPGMTEEGRKLRAAERRRPPRHRLSTTPKSAATPSAASSSAPTALRSATTSTTTTSRSCRRRTTSSSCRK